MVWWKILLRVVCSVLLVLSLVLFIVSMSFSQTFSYSNLKPVFIDSFKEQMDSINETELAYFHSGLVQNCTASGAETINVPLGDPGSSDSEAVDLKCADIINSEPPDLVDLIADGVFDEIYYKEYNQSFIDLIQQKGQGQQQQQHGQENEAFQIFVSKHASQFFEKISILFLIASIIFIILIVLLCVPKYTALVNLGIVSIILGFILLVMKTLGLNLPWPDEVFGIFSQFFNSLSLYFLTAFIAGIILLAAGITLIILQKRGQDKSSEKK